MIPLYTRVVAIDDVDDHLQKIVWGLGKAGFCALPFRFEDGKLENAPAQPLPGIRIVFTDIHLVGGGPNNEKTHAANIIKCLKQIVAPGPYVLVFWSQFPRDSDNIAVLIRERAPVAGLMPPIGHAAIDKNDVFKVAEPSRSEDFDAARLRDLILERISSFMTLAVAASWEDRVARAAARTTNRVFGLVRTAAAPTGDWENLLAFLACEAVGQHEARQELIPALDAALLPLLEDQLSLIGREPEPAAQDVQNLLDIVSAERRPACPASVTKSQLNASYLVEEFGADTDLPMWARGTVTALGSSFINSGPFVRAFHHDDATLIRQEFATRELTDDERRSTKLHVVEFGPECDHVQGKVSTHRYLLALLVPVPLMGAFTGVPKDAKKAPSTLRYRNDSVMDIGKITLAVSLPGEWHLLVSCRCFMALAQKTAVDGRPVFRLRRALMEEIAHRYTTHARRPGVMRFHD
ncbi:hypothetical protein [Derxia gummosa]|uniref:Response receiver domain-containing protein n=1 Tax=Derxia gummosa DSM 723 TaxID=1121388 RepID=A0A8B6X4F5_9BURK|nr:hypothetical protein [Derxia gummosa]